MQQEFEGGPAAEVVEEQDPRSSAAWIGEWMGWAADSDSGSGSGRTRELCVFVMLLKGSRPRQGRWEQVQPERQPRRQLRQSTELLGSLLVGLTIW